MNLDTICTYLHCTRTSLNAAFIIQPVICSRDFIRIPEAYCSYKVFKINYPYIYFYKLIIFGPFSLQAIYNCPPTHLAGPTLYPIGILRFSNSILINFRASQRKPSGNCYEVPCLTLLCEYPLKRLGNFPINTKTSDCAEELYGSDLCTKPAPH